MDIAPALSAKELRAWYRRSIGKSFTCTQPRVTSNDITLIRSIYYELKENQIVVWWKRGVVHFTGNIKNITTLSNRLKEQDINHNHCFSIKTGSWITVFKNQPSPEKQQHLDKWINLYQFNADKLFKED